MASLLLFNGRLWTQDRRYPQATALAIGNGRIVAVGEDEEIRALAGPGTRQVDLNERRVLPGLVDAHFHFRDWALARQWLNLAGAPSLAAVLATLRQAVSVTPPGQWIPGLGWNETVWDEARLPTAADLDAVAPHHPVLLKRSDLHLACANTQALQQAGIRETTPDPEGGLIVRDARGQATGILKDMAIDLVSQVMPEPTAPDVDKLMVGAIAEAHRLGLTGVHDFRLMTAQEGRHAFVAWQRLWARGDLRLRVWMMFPGDLLQEAIALGLRTGFGDDRLRFGGIKLFADGSLGARTAWMLDPYPEGGTGLPIVPMTEIAAKIALAQAHGITVGIHAIGDRAIRELLDVFSEVLPQRDVEIANEQTNEWANGRMGEWANQRRSGSAIQPLSHFALPHRIEHVQHSHPDDLRRLGELGLVASVQPLHLVDDMRLVDQSLSRGARWTYAFRSLLEGGAVLALGSDCPVANPNPFLGLQAAVTRQDRNGTPLGGWFPEQRLTVAEGVAGYTLGPAYASGQQDRSGSLSPGKLADLVVLDRDIFAVPPQEIGGTQVLMTIFDGAIVHEIDL